MPKLLGKDPIRKWDDIEHLPIKHGRPVLRGNFIELKPITSPFGDSVVLVIDHEPTGNLGVGNERQVWNCPTRLRLACERIIRAGQLIEIYFFGKTKIGSNTGFDFRVFQLEGPTDQVMEEHLKDADIDF